VATKRRYGVSTHLYHDQRLSRDHLFEIAAHGFDAVEVWATRTHFDYHNPAAVADLQQWLAEAGLELHGVDVPMGTAAEDTDHALFTARRLPMRVLVVHAGKPRETAREVERLADLASPLGVSIAVDSGSDSMSPAGSLVHFVESLDRVAGICLDFAHAQRGGDLIDAIETVSEHLITAHVPVDSAIDWPSALTAVQKVGYEGPFVFDVAGRAWAKETLRRARSVRERMERSFVAE
jgi:sugar phosphate isomerase/epimerase